MPEEESFAVLVRIMADYRWQCHCYHYHLWLTIDTIVNIVVIFTLINVTSVTVVVILIATTIVILIIIIFIIIVIIILLESTSTNLSVCLVASLGFVAKTPRRRLITLYSSQRKINMNNNLSKIIKISFNTPMITLYPFRDRSTWLNHRHNINTWNHYNILKDANDLSMLISG